MLWLYITISVLVILIAYVILSYFLAKKLHKRMFLKREEINKKISFYTNTEFGVERYEYDVNVNDGKIVGHFYHIDNYDDSKVIIFCHGMGSTKEAYIQEASYIASKGYLVYLFDYLGINESSGDAICGFSNSTYSLDLVIQALKNDEKYNSKDFYVMGHSWGGYATLNITSLHPDIKGIIGLAPMVSVFKTAKSSGKIKLNIPNYMFYLYDKSVFPKKYGKGTINSLKGYNGKIILVQSLDDPVVPYNLSLGLIQSKLKDKQIEYITLNNRFHCPDYTDEACKKWWDFNLEYRKARTEEEIDNLYKTTDFHACGELDTELWDSLLNKLFS